MNDLGIASAWLAVQVALVLAPAALLHAWASRRGPAAGAWVATASLAMVVALSVAAWPAGRLRRASTGPPAEDRDPSPPTAVAGAVVDSARPPSSGPVRSWRLSDMGLVWERIGREASAPAERCRPWGGVLAALATAGVGVGLVRIGLGLAAVRSCRRRSVAVSDRDLIALRDELAAALGVARPVEVREARDLPGPAAAGWLRPVVLLPADWRSWGDAERRAVLAHELAHVARGDYAAALLARAAVALHFYHPMVRRIAGRLLLQQEQAADALAARLAGGGAAYLAALSRLALRQDGRPPGWARAFLAGRGTLIRRIAMLREHDSDRGFDRPAPRRLRLATAALLAVLTAGVATLRGPAFGGEAAPAAPAGAFPLPYVGRDKCGLIAFRPAATLRRAGMRSYAPRLEALVRRLLMDGYAEAVSRALMVDTDAPGFLKLRAEDVELVTVGLSIGRRPHNAARDGGPDLPELHSLEVSGTTIRTVEPFNWSKCLRQWGLEWTEAVAGGRTYGKIAGSWARLLGRTPCVLVLDDRTVVFDEEDQLVAAIKGESRGPDFLRGRVWEEASRGLLAVGIDNHDGAFAKRYDRGFRDEATVLNFFRGVDHWALTVADADDLRVQARAACLDRDSGRFLDDVAGWGLLALRSWEELDPARPAQAGHEAAISLLRRFANGLSTNLSIDHSVQVFAKDFGTLAELAAVLDAEATESKRRDEQEAAERERRAGAGAAGPPATPHP